MNFQKAILFLSILFLVSCTKNIPIQNLETDIAIDENFYSKKVLENEIKGITVNHIAITDQNNLRETEKEGYKSIYLFVKGKGTVSAENKNYEIVPETILVPNDIKNINISSAKKNTLHFLKIDTKLTEQDKLDLKEFPKENTENIYYAKFTDCKSYTEPIKSPNTVSRTILPNKYLPRIAMGTVQTTGPDKVGAHEHPMLEQLFLGLQKNDCTVYADEAEVEFPEFSVLHIPLGSSHSVSVDKNKTLYYVWMDFFRDKKGEEWLKTHNEEEE